MNTLTLDDIANIRRELGIPWIKDENPFKFAYYQHVFWTHIGFAWDVFIRDLSEFTLEQAFKVGADETLTKFTSYGNGRGFIERTGLLYDLAKEIDLLCQLSKIQDTSVTVSFSVDKVNVVRGLCKKVNPKNMQFCVTSESNNGSVCKTGGSIGYPLAFNVERGVIDETRGNYRAQNKHLETIAQFNPYIFLLGTYAQGCVKHTLSDLKKIFDQVTVLSDYCTDRCFNTEDTLCDVDPQYKFGDDKAPLHEFLETIRDTDGLDQQIEFILSRGKDLFGSNYAHLFYVAQGQESVIKVLSEQETKELFQLT